MSDRFRYAALPAVAALVLALGGCGEDNPAAPDDGSQPTRLPAVPVPTSPTDALPPKSEELVVGTSSALPDFRPDVEELRQMADDGTSAWTLQNRPLKLVCDGVLARNTCDPAASEPTYVTAAPRLMHIRYWKRLKQVTLDPGTSYSQAQTVTYGSSTTNTESQTFSTTIGVEVSASAGWGAFSASVSASFEQTETHEEINSVTFSEESSFTETYAVESDPNRTIVYALWQLVDVFALVDAGGTPIDESGALVHVKIPAIPRLEFANKDVIYQSVTRF